MIVSLTNEYKYIVTTQKATVFRAEVGDCFITTNNDDVGITLKQGETYLIGSNFEIRAKTNLGNASLSYLEVGGGQFEITNDEGNPIRISATDLPLPTGASTSLNQVTQIGYLADLADKSDKYANYKFIQSEDLGVGVKYILKSDGINWLILRKTYTNTNNLMEYAGSWNNSGITLNTCWGQKTSLVYGLIN